MLEPFWVGVWAPPTTPDHKPITYHAWRVFYLWEVETNPRMPLLRPYTWEAERRFVTFPDNTPLLCYTWSMRLTREINASVCKTKIGNSVVSRREMSCNSKCRKSFTLHFTLPGKLAILTLATSFSSLITYIKIEWIKVFFYNSLPQVV